VRVDRVHLVARGQQRAHQQPPVGLDPNHHLGWALSMSSHQRVQLAYAGQPIGDPPGRQHHPVLVQKAQVRVVVLAPVDSEKQHPSPPWLRRAVCELEKDLRRPNGRAHLARHPTSRPPSSTPAGARSPPRAPGLPSLRVLTGWWLRRSLPSKARAAPLGPPPGPLRPTAAGLASIAHSCGQRFARIPPDLGGCVCSGKHSTTQFGRAFNGEGYQAHPAPDRSGLTVGLSSLSSRR
jgi:hypothetical protein